MDKELLIDYTPGSAAFFYTVLSFIAFGVARLLVYEIKFTGNFRTPRNIRFYTLDISIDKAHCSHLIFANSYLYI